VAFDVHGSARLALEDLPELMIDAGYKFTGAEFEALGTVLENEAGYQLFRLSNGQEVPLASDGLELGPQTLSATIAVVDGEAILTPR